MKLARFAFAGVMFAGALAASTIASAAELLTIQLKDGPVVIELAPDVAPKHVAQIEALAKKGAYDNVAFHRVIDGFMAQTGDVQYGNMEKGFSAQRAGTGGSDLPDIPAEFSKVPFTRGVVGMARSQDPNSANSQFFIMFADGPFLNGQYTVVGKVVSGMEAVDKIKRGAGGNGEVSNPDRMIKVTVGKK
ncbi:MULTISPECIES: peptidylprolyl isomerase [unclassified Agrobacterium]|jgi:cyclophilin family peptidyl-prolyl cis-trans isomerase|nr:MULTISPECIES: peptidylprolyl isomerase [unclassified Agrobacterium]MDH0613373.1 peptidylprolyl isomerase [Agrobacterium sp. GD03872]MDH0697290.1 peptidylprolyl isomerase [Agrobacterium sp. GD03871]MDH1060813.1 peptidylprolyl isomerase [Agrobacterium sp. GD03992]MDH2211397.1 peptidylprolyl isomerase [Agrobacterium sp. GD03643]MDH2220656.1 peptidylprolyl isomerase [Agrobacterium sp. GD03638]